MLDFISKRISKENRKGFTIIELMIIIGVLAVLITLGVPAIAGQVSNSKQSAVDNDVRVLASAMAQVVTNLQVEGYSTTQTKNSIVANTNTSTTSSTYLPSRQTVLDLALAQCMMSYKNPRMSTSTGDGVITEVWYTVQVKDGRDVGIIIDYIALKDVDGYEGEYGEISSTSVAALTT